MYEDGREHEMHVYMLGPPRVLWQGDLLPVTRRQVRALLYRLASSRAPLSRDELSFLLWPDIPQAKARRHLTHLLTHLRRTLPDASLVETSRFGIQVDRDRVWVDTDAFLHLLETGTIPAIEEAATLYKGPFLAGFSLPTNPEFEHWLIAERQVWEQRYLTVLRRLVEWYSSQRVWEKAIHYARLYLETDNLAEDVHRRLMALYAAAGNRAAALRQFEICITVLDRELGISPLPETRALYESILTGHTASRYIPPDRGPSPSLSDIRVPFTGREHALATLMRSYNSISTRGRVILISGEAGIGKSRLVREFVQNVPGRVFFACAQPGTQGLPYYPVVQALRPVVYERMASLRDWASQWLGELTRIWPELRSHVPDLPVPLAGSPEEVRLRLFEALARLLFLLGEGPHPAVLWLDDLHWADQTTLEWVAYLTSHLSEVRMLVVGTYRVEEAEKVRGLRHHLRRLGMLEDLFLSPLTHADIRHIVGHLFGAAADDDDFVERLHRATGGNPFFLLETMRVLREQQGGFHVADLRDLPLPDTVCQAVESRLSLLQPQTRQVLEAGSILEDRFSFDVIRLVAGRSEAEVASALEELVARQLLVLRDGRYHFAHDLVRRAVEHGLNPVRRQLLHRRAAGAIARLHPQALITLAQHLERSAQFEEALATYLRAAAQVQTIGAWQEVEQCYTRALALLDRLDPDGCHPVYVHRRGDILLDRAHIRFLQGRLQERDADISLLEQWGERCQSERLRLQACLARSRYLNLDGRYAEALKAARAGLQFAVRLEDTAAQSRLLARMGFAHYFRGEYEVAMEVLHRALDLEKEESAARAEVLSVLSYAYYLVADYVRSLDYRRQALSIRQRLGRLARVAEDLTDMGVLYTRLNQWEDARRYLEDALSLARRIGSQPAESYALNNLGNLYYVEGNYPAALEHYYQSLVLQRATGSRRGEASALGNAGMAHLALGNYKQAEVLIRQSIAIEEEIGYESGLAEDWAHLGQTLLAQGSADAAFDAAHRALRIARRIRDPYCRVLALNTLADVCLHRGEFIPALDYARNALAAAQESGLTQGRVWALTMMARAWLLQGEGTSAFRSSQEAVELLETLGGLEGPAERVYGVHAMALSAIGERQAAACALLQARALVHSKARFIPDPLQRRHYLQTALRRCRQ